MEPLTEGRKYDQGKPRFELLPAQALTEVVRVLTFGAAKYEDENWRKVVPHSRYVGAAFRHLVAYLGGEKFDPETGLHHLSHMVCCGLFLITFDLEEKNEPSK